MPGEHVHLKKIPHTINLRHVKLQIKVLLERMMFTGNFIKQNQLFGKYNLLTN